MAKQLTLEQAGKKLIKAYAWRQKRYSESVVGLRKHAGNCCHFSGYTGPDFSAKLVHLFSAKVVHFALLANVSG